MLYLTRNLREKVYIYHRGERLTITIEKAKDNQARLACDGPRSFVIHRFELIDPNEKNEVTKCQ